MKPTIFRRIRRHPANREAASFSKDKQQEQSFFGETSHDPFFKSSNGMSAVQSVQLKASVSVTDTTQIQRMDDKKEEDKIVQRKSEEEKDKVQKKAQNPEEDDKIRKKEEKEEEKVRKKANDPEEEEKIQKKEEKKDEEKVMKKEEEKDKNEESKIQRKETSVASQATTGNYISSMNGKGNQLPADVNAFFSSRMGYDFSDVKVHSDREAADSAKELNAKAYTVKNNIVFNEGQLNTETSDGKKLMAHELTHVVQQSSATVKVQTQAAPLLTPAQETAAIQFNRRKYDRRSIRIIQIITGSGVDGSFGSASARAVAAFQQENGVTINGQVNEATLNAMISGRKTENRYEHIVQLVTDYFNIPASDTLSIHFDNTLGLWPIAVTDFEPGNLRVIRLGDPAFVSAGILQIVINNQLAVPAPAVSPLSPRPALLNAAQEVNAILFNTNKYADKRSIRIIQGFVLANPDGNWGRDTVQRVAEFQQTNGLTVDGQVGELTLSQLSNDLIAAGNQNSSIRLISDFFNFRDNGNLLDIYYDPAVTANASTDFRVNEPVRILVGPDGINQSFEGLVHTIAHEFEHVRRLKEGIVTVATHEFLGEAIEILSRGMPSEEIESLAPASAVFASGFADDARRALANWNVMPLADQRRFKTRFIAVRNVVRRRIAGSSAEQQVLHANLLAGYNAVVLP
jgi:peptidoglycan hydrolase-like protein with peptidoglycan-binding domain